jgi:hypothetical protein
LWNGSTEDIRLSWVEKYHHQSLWLNPKSRKGEFMRSKSFSYSEVLGFGWSVMKDNFLFFLGVNVVSIIIYTPRQILDGVMKHCPGRIPPFLFFALLPVVLIVEIILGIGLIKIALSFCDGLKPRFSTLFNAWDCFWRYVGAGLLYFLILVGASMPYVLLFMLPSHVMRCPYSACSSWFAWPVLVAIFIPVVILSIKFSLCFYFAIDKGLGPINALRASSRATKGAKWSLFVFGILCCLISFLGAICFLVGLFATNPTVMVAMALVYRRLSGQTPELAELGISAPIVEPIAGAGGQFVAGTQFDSAIQCEEGKKSNNSSSWLTALVILSVMLVAGIGYRFWPRSKGEFAKVPLTGILYSEDNPSVVIDGKIVKEGDIINGIKVVKIHKDGVEFEKKGKKWTQQVR